MKRILLGMLVLSSVSAFSANEVSTVKIVITSDTKELCKAASDSVAQNIESDMRAVNAEFDSVTICNKGLDGKYRQRSQYNKTNR